MKHYYQYLMIANSFLLIAIASQIITQDIVYFVFWLIFYGPFLIVFILFCIADCLDSDSRSDDEQHSII
jgi:hypothetical protein|nr:MAG TPA: oxidoreductase [Caudoviricetes sp.]